MVAGGCCTRGKGNHQLNPNYITGFVDGFYKKEIKLFSTNQQSCTNNHLSLVVWGTNLSSLVGKRRITKQESNMIKLPPYPKGRITVIRWLTNLCISQP